MVTEQDFLNMNLQKKAAAASGEIWDRTASVSSSVSDLLPLRWRSLKQNLIQSLKDDVNDIIFVLKGYH